MTIDIKNFFNQIMLMPLLSDLWADQQNSTLSVPNCFTYSVVIEVVANSHLWSDPWILYILKKGSSSRYLEMTDILTLFSGTQRGFEERLRNHAPCPWQNTFKVMAKDVVCEFQLLPGSVLSSGWSTSSPTLWLACKPQLPRTLSPHHFPQAIYFSLMSSWIRRSGSLFLW